MLLVVGSQLPIPNQSVGIVSSQLCVLIHCDLKMSFVFLHQQKELFWRKFAPQYNKTNEFAVFAHNFTWVDTK
jgi:hypothetical protein